MYSICSNCCTVPNIYPCIYHIKYPYIHIIYSKYSTKYISIHISYAVSICIINSKYSTKYISISISYKVSIYIYISYTVNTVPNIYPYIYHIQYPYIYIIYSQYSTKYTSYSKRTHSIVFACEHAKRTGTHSIAREHILE